MCRYNKKNDSRFLDPCMEKLIDFINANTTYKTLACCCGHGKYPMTIIITSTLDGDDIGNVELLSGKRIWRKKKFYKKDKQGRHFIPETVENK